MARKLFSKRLHFEANTGFGASASAQGNRLLKRDGSFNVKRKGLAFAERINVYHELINMPWRKFVLLVLATYTFINICFAFSYLGVGMEEIEGDSGQTFVEQFWDAFFFSSQTLTTVGYGRTSPIGFHANLVAAVECLVGLMMFAIITGLLYGRFSHPVAKLIYSHNAIIAPFKDNNNALMFRLANARRNQLIECEAEVMMSFIEPETQVRRFLFLDLEFKRVTGLALSWTIVHPITTESPLFNLTSEDINEMQAEFILIFKAFDDTYSQTVHTRYSYTSHELVWGAKFVPMYHSSEDKNATVLELNKIGEYQSALLFDYSPLNSKLTENT